MFCHASFYEIGDVDTDVALSADYRQAKTLNNRNNTDKLISKSIVICNFEKRGCSRNLSLMAFMTFHSSQSASLFRVQNRLAFILTKVPFRLSWLTRLEWLRRRPPLATEVRRVKLWVWHSAKFDAKFWLRPRECNRAGRNRQLLGLDHLRVKGDSNKALGREAKEQSN